MKWILAILLLISATTFGQIGRGDDSLKYIRYQNQYGQRMPRSWWDSVAHMPYGDTAIFPKPSRPGAIMMHTDKVFYKWNGGGWEGMGSGSGSPSGPAGGDLTGTYPNPTVGNNAVTNAKAAQMAAHTFKGNNIGSTANASDLTSTQLTAELNVFGASVKGLVPAASGSPSSSKYLSEDGTFSTPAGGGSGVTTMAAIGSSPNNNGASIFGSTLTLQPADATHGGVVTNGDQKFAGNKDFLGKTTTFQGLSPRLNTQYIPTQVVSDTIHNGHYLGFGGIDIFPSGTYVHIYSDTRNHVGDSGIIKMGKSIDQGRHWDTAIIAKSDSALALGAMGVSQSGRLLLFYQKIDPQTTGYGNMYIKYSDDEGLSWSDSIIIPHTGGHSNYTPYGGLVKIANNGLLFSWYGYTVSGAYTTYVIRSFDNGATWSSAITVFSNNNVRPTEAMYTHLGGGVLIGLVRSDSTFTYTQLKSNDNGSTWDSVGRVAFGTQGTPPWLKTYENEYGNRVCVCYYRYSPTVFIREIRAIYAYADSLIINGAAGWDMTTEKTLVTNQNGSGYISVVHPNDKPGAYAEYYDETSAQLITTIKFLRLPNVFASPIGSKGIFGMTAGRIPVVNSYNSLIDYNAFRYNSEDTAILMGSTAGSDWGDIEGAIQGGNSALMLNNGVIGFMHNLYLGRVGGVSDYRYASNGAASVMFGTGGEFFFYTAPAGSINASASLTSRLRLGGAGEYYINGLAGTAGYSLFSNGVGSPAGWRATYLTLADFPADANNSGTSETDLYSYSMPGATLHANLQKVWFDVGGDFTDATATPRIRLYFAGTLIYDSGVLTLTGTGSWSATVMLMRTNSGIARAKVVFSCDNSNLSNNVDITEISSLDFTSTNILKITGTATGAGGGSSDITGKMGTIYFTPQQ